MIDAISQIFQPLVLAMALAGTLLGMFFGAIPGIGPPLAMVMMFPIIFGMEPFPALALILGVYSGSTYGGSISAILINTPGTPGSIATTFDGYPMAQKGQAGTALGASVMSSVVGGLFSVAVFYVFYSPLSSLFVKFGPSQMFMLMLVALLMVITFVQEELLKGGIATGIGLMIGSIGRDIMTGTSRFTFGFMQIEDGFDLIAVLLAWFAVTELMFLVLKRNEAVSVSKLKGSIIQGAIKVFKYPRILLESTLLGCILGALPGVGIAAANFLAYRQAQMHTKNPDVPFGKGFIGGVIAPEAANNAVTSTSLIPTMALGVPGSASAAVILGALMLLGFRPGPGILDTFPGLINGLVVCLVVIHIILLFLGLGLANFFSKVTLIKVSVLVPIILAVCFLGGYLARFRLTDVLIMIILGIFGYILRKAKYPIACMVLGFVLSTLIEDNLFKSIVIMDSPAIFFQGTINITIISIGFLFIAWRPLLRLWRLSVSKFQIKA